MQTQCSTIREAVHTLRNRIVEENFAARENAERVADISNHFHFAKNDGLTFFVAPNVPTQLAMDMTEKVSGRVRTVICANVEGEWTWFVENMSKCPVEAADLIACVRQRIGAKLSGQLTGKVTVN